MHARRALNFYRLVKESRMPLDRRDKHRRFHIAIAIARGRIAAPPVIQHDRSCQSAAKQGAVNGSGARPIMTVSDSAFRTSAIFRSLKL